MYQMGFVGIYCDSWVDTGSVHVCCGRREGLNRRVHLRRRAKYDVIRCAEVEGASEFDAGTLREMLTTGKRADRARAVNLARHLPPADCLDLLLEAVTSKDPQIRYAAISQMAEVGKTDPDRVMKVAAELLVADPESSVQSGAADVLASLQVPGAFDILEEALRNTKDWMLQFSILAGLGELGDQRAYDVLVEAMSSEEDLLRVAAVGALGELGDVRAIPLIEELAEKAEDPALRDRAQYALNRLKSA
uniref:Phycocyanin alpha phycocyanobilin lyase n=1 Tax=Compsopogon caeruleus TaxID=31354 RepID=A0A7S1TDD5_9RHOD